MGGLYERAILGSGDHIMSLSLIQKGTCAVNAESTEDYKESILDFQDRVKRLRLGYVPGVIRHYFHGSKKNRGYAERWQILLKWGFSPTTHVTNDSDGILVPTKKCPPELLKDIMDYFRSRNEDEFYQTKDTAEEESGSEEEEEEESGSEEEEEESGSEEEEEESGSEEEEESGSEEEEESGSEEEEEEVSHIEDEEYDSEYEEDTDSDVTTPHLFANFLKKWFFTPEN
jgi:hypothetical protein